MTRNAKYPSTCTRTERTHQPEREPGATSSTLGGLTQTSVRYLLAWTPEYGWWWCRHPTSLQHPYPIGILWIPRTYIARYSLYFAAPSPLDRPLRRPRADERSSPRRAESAGRPFHPHTRTLALFIPALPHGPPLHRRYRQPCPPVLCRTLNAHVTSRERATRFLLFSPRGVWCVYPLLDASIFFSLWQLA